MNVVKRVFIFLMFSVSVLYSGDFKNRVSRKSQHDLDDLIVNFFDSVKKGLIEKVDEMLSLKDASGKTLFDVNVADNAGKTLLMIACIHGHLGLVQYLLAQGADVNAVDNVGNTALMLACMRDNLEIVQLLLAAKSDVNLADQWGGTPLMAAAFWGNASIVKWLFFYAPDVNAVDDEGDTALMMASQKGHVPIVQILLWAHADIDMVNKSGETALVIAKNNKHTEVVDILENFQKYREGRKGAVRLPAGPLARIK